LITYLKLYGTEQNDTSNRTVPMIFWHGGLARKCSTEYCRLIWVIFLNKRWKQCDHVQITDLALPTSVRQFYSWGWGLWLSTVQQGGWITVTTQPYYACVDFSDPSLFRGGCLLYRIDVLTVHADLCDNFNFCVPFWCFSSRHEMKTIPAFSYNPNNVHYSLKRLIYCQRQLETRL